MLSKIKTLRPRQAGTFLLTAVAVIGAYKIIMNIEDVARWLYSAVSYAWDLLAPFVIGAVVAYLINPAVIFFETRLYGKLRKKAKASRVLSIAAAYAILGAALVIILNLLIPLLVKSAADIINSIPAYYSKFQALKSGQWNDTVTGRLLSSLFAAGERELSQLLAQNNLNALNPAITGLVDGVINFGGTVLDGVLGIVISVYFILEKENLLRGTKRICRAFFKDETCEKLSSHTADAHKILSKFVVGKTLDSLIIGVICTAGLMILNVKNAALFGVIVGVTNMIPYFGPFIGGVPVVLLVLFESPLKALWVGLFIFALQQFDGVILGPKILGNSINLSPFWIIFAILIGGGLFGVAGMFLGAPALAVIMQETSRLLDNRISAKEPIKTPTPPPDAETDTDEINGE
ncbi:MAG: AI-2E family transporter [Ruminococcaceae bacterium]|nr:AI-2E family transporter [Oscillospiraceae bacterium]